MRSTASFAAFAAILTLPLPARAQAATYDLSFKPKPTKGYAFRDVEKSKISLKLKMIKDGKVMLTTSDTSSEAFDVKRTVLEVQGDEVVKEKMEFAKASHVVEGETVSYSFEGKTVLVSFEAGKGTSYACEDGTVLSEDDLKALKEFRKPNEDTRSGDELLAPGKPVKVGESWKPDVKAVAVDMLSLSGADAVNAEKSSIKLTLKKVTKKDGVDMALVKGTFTLFVYEVGEIRLLKPVLTKITMQLEAATDGSVPDGKADMKMQIKGTAPMELEKGEQATVQIGMNAEFSKTSTTAK